MAIDLSQILSIVINYFIFGVLAFIGGYIVGYIVSKVIGKLLTLGKLQKALVSLGAVTTNVWESMVNFITQITKWWLVTYVVVWWYTIAFKVVDIQQDIVVLFFKFVSGLFLLFLLTILGVVIGGVLRKITKDFLVSIGLEAELEKHHVSDSIGGISISNILASIVKWYTVLLFTWQGLIVFDALFDLAPHINMLGKVMGGFLIGYVPQAVLGLLVIMISLIIADFAGNNIRKRRAPFVEILGLGVEIIIVFFGAVFALPKFGIENVSILEDSFKILMIGLSLGLAIAIGLGLKDSVAETAIEVRKKS